MIVHRGRGGLIAFITFLCLLAAEAYTRAHYRDQQYYQQHSWPKLAACLVSALLVWWLSPRIPQTAGTSAERQTWLVSSSLDAPAHMAEAPAFKLTLFRDSDSLFFIPVKYWPLLLCALGVVLYFVPQTALP
jgi:hypothetical protein